MHLKLFLTTLTLILTTKTIREYKRNLIYNTILNSKISKNRISCLSSFTQKKLISNFSEIFNPFCKTLKNCYEKINQNFYTKQNCDDNFKNDLISTCENFFYIKKIFCLKKAENWYNFVKNNLDDFYNKISEKRKIVISVRGNNCLFIGKGDEFYNGDCNGSPDKFYYLVKITENTTQNSFLLYNVFIDKCLAVTDAVGGVNKFLDCDVTDTRFFFSLKQGTGSYTNYYSIRNEGFKDDCVDQEGILIKGCVKADPFDLDEIYFGFTYSNGDLADISEFVVE